jgi:hypothetical protein
MATTYDDYEKANRRLGRMAVKTLGSRRNGQTGLNEGQTGLNEEVTRPIGQARAVDSMTPACRDGPRIVRSFGSVLTGAIARGIDAIRDAQPIGPIAISLEFAAKPELAAGLLSATVVASAPQKPRDVAAVAARGLPGVPGITNMAGGA